MAKVRGVYENPKGSKIFWIQYFDHGRRKRERVGTEANAIKLYQKRKTQILMGQKLPELQRRKTTVGELLDDTLRYIENQGHKSKSTYVHRINQVREAFGTRFAEDLTSAEIERWIDGRKVGKERANLSSSTFNRIRAFFSLMYREGMHSGKVGSNPAPKIRQRREPRGRKRFLVQEEKEYTTLLNKLAEQYPERVPHFQFSVFTGARLGEQFRLRWREVNFDRREITLLDTKNGDARTLPMNSVVYGVLKSMHREELPRRAKVFGSLRVFCAKTVSKSGKEAKVSDSPKWFGKLCEDCGIDDYTWHNNRHTFCSWLAIAGTPLKTIQELAGHRSIQVTAGYAHLSPDHKRSEIERMVPDAKPKVLEFPDARAAG